MFFSDLVCIFPVLHGVDDRLFSESNCAEVVNLSHGLLRLKEEFLYLDNSFVRDPRTAFAGTPLATFRHLAISPALHLYDFAHGLLLKELPG